MKACQVLTYPAMWRGTFHEFTTPPTVPKFSHFYGIFDIMFVDMSSNSKLIADIEALLKSAKASNIDELDYTTRVEMLGTVESIQHQLDDPILAMFRHISNVCRSMLIYRVYLLLKIQSFRPTILLLCGLFFKWEF